jgi:hypothetical protein
MGTRSIVRVFDGKQELCTIYRHFDGYPSAMGKDLKDLLDGKRVVNGLSGDPSELNRAGCVATHLIVGLATHSPEILQTGLKDCGQRYEYHVLCPDVETLGFSKWERGKPRGLPIELKCFHGEVQLPEVDVDPTSGDDE